MLVARKRVDIMSLLTTTICIYGRRARYRIVISVLRDCDKRVEKFYMSPLTTICILGSCPGSTVYDYACNPAGFEPTIGYGWTIR